MTQQILQINFKFHLSCDAYREAVAPVAEPIAAVPGLLWKVWLLNDWMVAESDGVDAAAGGGLIVAHGPARISARLTSAF